MILPRNGKVVIFDDIYEDVKDLLGALSKEKVPYLYFQDEGGADLPEVPIQNVRLVFLDLELVTGQKMSDHDIVSAIGGRLERVLEKDNKYILIYWSTKRDKYQETLEKAFNDRLRDYKPIVTLSLDKIEAIKHQVEPIPFILSEIEERTNDFKLFEVFSLWENLVNDSAGILVNDFTSFIKSDENWDKGAKFVLYKLAQAYSGKRMNKKSGAEQLKDAYFTLNHTFIDSIENSVLKCIDEQPETFEGLISNEGIDDIGYSPIINRRLLISKMDVNGLVPGGLFFTENELDDQKNVFQKSFETLKRNDRIPADKLDKAIENAENKLKNQIEGLDSFRRSLSKNYNSIVNSFIVEENSESRKIVIKEILSDSIKIELNISPLCDFAQEKMPCVRLLPGLLINSNHLEKLNQKNAYNYFSDGILKYGENFYKIVFDFRFLYSRPESLLRSKVTSYKLRHQILADIQLKLGSHVNRSGVLFVQ